MKNIVNFFIVIILLFNLSCSKSEEKKVGIQEDFRQKFISYTNNEHIREDFNSLPLNLKKELWKSKFDNLLEQNFDYVIKQDIQSLKELIENTDGHFLKDTRTKNVLINLAKQIPMLDYYLMFSSLIDYEYTGKFIGNKKIGQDFFEYIEEEEQQLLKSSGLKATSIENEKIKEELSCNCSWCLFGGDASTTGNCKKTYYGCGLLFLQSCDKRFTLDYRYLPPEDVLKLDTINGFIRLNKEFKLDESIK